MITELPKIVPINELKNTAQISKECKESDVPIVVTKNGYSDMVIMSVSLYNNTFKKYRDAMLINEALEHIKNGDKGMDGDLFFQKMREKYGTK